MARTYYLESNQADRVSFDEMVERGLEAALNALTLNEAAFYIHEDPKAFIGVQWDMDSATFTAESPEYAEDMGLTFVEDMDEAKARYYAVGENLLKDLARRWPEYQPVSLKLKALAIAALRRGESDRDAMDSIQKATRRNVPRDELARAVEAAHQAKLARPLE